MQAALAAAGRCRSTRSVFADGVAVRQAGDETYRLCSHLLDDVITVSTDEICAAIKDISITPAPLRSRRRPLARRARKHAGELAQPGAAIAIASGANMHFDRLRHVAERAEIGERSEALLGVTIPERPGAYRAFIRLLGNRAITEFNYRIAPGAEAQIFVGVALKGGEREKHEIIAMLRAGGHAVVDMTDNELAKLHIRYMVGGRGRAGRRAALSLRIPRAAGRC